MSCASVGVCVAVGGDIEGGGFIETLSKGTWSPLAELAYSFFSVSCVSASTCVAVGRDNTADDGLIETLSNGTWSPLEVPAEGYTLGQCLVYQQRRA